jgi:hypothetical protein
MPCVRVLLKNAELNAEQYFNYPRTEHIANMVEVCSEALQNKQIIT